MIARLLCQERQVLALGGGAFIDPDTRALVRAQAVSIWLRADLDTLVRRTGRPSKRPLLTEGDPRDSWPNCSISGRRSTPRRI